MNEKEVARQKTEKIVKILILLVGGFFVAPFVFIAVKGLIGAVLAVAVGLTVIQLAPWFAAKMGNIRLKMLKNEAMKNPVETLQRDFMTRQEALKKFRNSIVTFGAAIQNFADKLAGFQKQFPSEASNFLEKLNKMKQLLAFRTKKLYEAESGLRGYALEIEKAEAIWEMSVEAAKMNEAAGVDMDEFERQLQVKTAIGSIQNNLNSAFSELELSLQEEKNLQDQRFGQSTTTVGNETPVLDTPNDQIYTGGAPRQKVKV